MHLVSSLSANLAVLAASSPSDSTPPILQLVPQGPQIVDSISNQPPANDVVGSAMTSAIYDRRVVEEAIKELLSQELDRECGNAATFAAMAAQLTDTIRANLPVLTAVLSEPQQDTIRKIANVSHISVEKAQIEYLANASLFRALRDYHELPRRNRVSMHDYSGGFMALTRNGSMISSGPHVYARPERMFHYMRMPSRILDVPPTSSKAGHLTADIVVGRRFRSTAWNASAVSMLLYVGSEQADKFEVLREWASIGASSIHRSVILTVEPKEPDES